MSNLSVKRQRANTNGDATIPSKSSDEYRKVIATFDERTLRDLLLFAAQKSSQIAAQIIARRDDISEADRPGAIEVDHFSKSEGLGVVQEGDPSGSRQYQLGLEVSITIEETIAKTKEQTSCHTAFDTKKSALVTLRKIAKTACLGGNDRMGHECKNQLCQDDGPLDKAMHDIVDGIGEDERDRMRNEQEWVDKVKDLVALGRNDDIHETLDQLLDKLSAGVVEDRAQKPETNLKTVESIMPETQAPKSKKARVKCWDM